MRVFFVSLHAAVFKSSVGWALEGFVVCMLRLEMWILESAVRALF